MGGAVGGGAAGFGAYSKRDDIRKAASKVASTVGDGTAYVKGKASQSRTLLQSAASGARARLVGGKKLIEPMRHVRGGRCMSPIFRFQVGKREIAPSASRQAEAMKRYRSGGFLLFHGCARAFERIWHWPARGAGSSLKTLLAAICATLSDQGKCKLHRLCAARARVVLLCAAV